MEKRCLCTADIGVRFPGPPPKFLQKKENI